MCMWQSQACSGALSLGGSVPVEFGTACWPWLCRPIVEAVPAIAIMEAFLMNVRRAIMLISLISRRMEHPVPDRQEGLEGFGYHFLNRPNRRSCRSKRVSELKRIVSVAFFAAAIPA